MKKGLNNLQIMGNVGDKIKLLYYPDGTPYLTFSIAVNDFYKNQENEEKTTTHWFDCRINGDRANTFEPHIKQGIALYCSGKVTGSAWQPVDENNQPKGEPRASLQLLVRDLIFVGNKPQGQELIPEVNSIEEDAEQLFPD